MNLSMSLSLAVCAQIAAYVLQGMLSPSLFRPSNPSYSLLDLCVTLLCIASSGLFVLYARALRQRRLSNLPHHSDSAASMFSEGMSQLIVGGSLLLNFCIVFVYLSAPHTWRTLAREDGWVENASALLCFLASALFIVIACKVRRMQKNGADCSAGFFILACGFAGIFCLIALEEISWFQRVFSYATPEMLQGNRWQKEMNLHNFSTTKAELIYYTGLGLFLVLFPLAKDCQMLPRRFPAVRFYTPSHVALCMGALASAYNFELWNTIPTQTLFFFTVFVLLLYYFAIPPLRKTPLWPICILACLIIQGTFLSYPPAYFRRGVNEYKEMLLPLASVIFAIETLMKVRTRVGVQAGAPATAP